MTIALDRELAHEGLLESISNQPDYLILRQPFKLEDIRKLDTLFANKLESKQKDFGITISYPFIKTLADLLKEKRGFCRNFVLNGPPSAGKTTELRSIATYLHSCLPTASKKTLHFCSIQNTSASHKKIESADDLWNLILSSHCSKHWANKNSTPVEFLQWHEDCGFEPILFIDTIDLLTYGINFLNIERRGQKNIAKYWEELMEILNSNEKVKPSILWSSREIEWNELSENIDLEKKSSPKGCRIKSLSPTDVDSKGIAKIFQRREDKQFFRYLQQSFPILAGYARRKILPEEVIFRLLEQLKNISIAADYKPRESDSPILWILKEMDGSFATDVLYNSLVEKICEKTVRAFEDEFDLQEVVRIWQEGVEEVFFHESLPQYNIGGRIQVKIEPDSEVLEHLLYLANRNGLLKEHWGKVYEMGHQLFVEYCIYKHGKNSRHVRPKLLGFPSIWLRFLRTEKQPDSEKNNKRFKQRVEEAKDWLYPFAVFNKKLVHYQEDKFLSLQWTELINLAISVQESNVTSSIPETKDTNSIHWLNDEKRNMLENHNLSQDPLLINGPPGVGKSHISFVWADSKSFQIAGRKWVPVNEGENDDIRKASLKNEQLNAMFMTLNRNLIEQQKNRIKEYYKGSIFRPLSWNTFDIESYIEELCFNLNIQWKKLDYRLFEQSFRTEKIRSLKLPYLTDVRRKTIPSLWLEYQTNYINIDGKKRTTAEYSASRSELFGTDDDEETEARKAFADYCESQFEKYHSIPEISGIILEKVLEIETLGTREEKERLQTLKSDILILDEVQDLTAPIISLLLIMHRGPLNSIMICGDDEQTLLITPFSWGRTFSRINTLFYKKHNEFPKSSQLSKLLEIKWGEHAEKYIKDLVVVERNVKDIVNFIADSWNTSIGPIVSSNLESPVRGAGAVLPGQRSKDKEKSLQSQGKRTGVFQQDIDREELFKVCEKIYESDQDAAVVFTDESIQEEFYQELEQKNISIPLFTPSNIKGLEYPVIIAVSPWSMDVKIIQESLKGDLNSWEKITNYYNQVGNSNLLRKKIIEDISRQRKRFANIILSRAENILMVYNLTSKTPGNQDRFIHFDKPETFSSKKEMNLDYSFWSTSNQEMVDEEKTSKTNTSADRLIARLCTMIDSANHKENQKEISMQALHVGHVLQLQLTNHPMRNELLLPFKLIGDYDSTYQQKTPEVIVKELLDEIENICGRISIHNWIKEQVQCIKIVQEGGKLQIPFSRYCKFEDELKDGQFSKVFSPHIDCYSERFENRTGLNIDSASEKIKTYLMGLYLTKLGKENTNLDENPVRWLEIFDRLDGENNCVNLPLLGREIKNPRDKIFELLINEKTNSNSKSDKDIVEDASSFWESGKNLLQKDVYDKQWKGRKTGFSQDEKEKIFTKLLDYKTLENQYFEPSLYEFFKELFETHVSSTDYAGMEVKYRIKKSLRGLFKLSFKYDSQPWFSVHSYHFLNYLQSDQDMLRKLINENPVNIWTKLKELLQEKHEIKDGEIKAEKEKKEISLSDLSNTLLKLLHKEAEKGNLAAVKIGSEPPNQLIGEVMSAHQAILKSNLFSIQKFDTLTGKARKDYPKRFRDIFDLKTTSKSVRDYFLKNIDSDSQKSIILRLFYNIYHPLAKVYADNYDMETEKENASAAIEEMVDGIKEIFNHDELESLLDLSLFERIVNIPNFGINQEDMVFGRQLNKKAKLSNDINDNWLQMVENKVLHEIPGIEPILIQKINDMITEIRIDNFNFNRIYRNNENKNHMMQKHISQHIQNHEWVSAGLKKYPELDQDSKDNLLMNHFIDSKDKEGHVGLFSHYDLMRLYDKLIKIRKDWKNIASNLNVYEVCDSLPPIPKGLLITQYSEHGSLKNWSNIEDAFGISKEIFSTLKKLENDREREKLIQNLNLVINQMTEPSFYLTTMLDRFDKIIKGDFVYWPTLRKDLFSKSATHPQLFSSAVSSNERIQLCYADFENCVINSTKLTRLSGDLFPQKMDDLVIPFIRLIQSYGIPVPNREFDPTLVKTTTDKSKEKIRTDSETFEQELAMRLTNEIKNLPTLERLDD